MPLPAARRLRRRIAAKHPVMHHPPMALSFSQRIEQLHLQRFLLTGMLTLLPVWLTWVVFKFVFVLLAGISQPWIEAIFSPLSRNFPVAFGWLGSTWLQ